MIDLHVCYPEMNASIVSIIRVFDSFPKYVTVQIVKCFNPCLEFSLPSVRSIEIKWLLLAGTCRSINVIGSKKIKTIYELRVCRVLQDDLMKWFIFGFVFLDVDSLVVAMNAMFVRRFYKYNDSSYRLKQFRIIDMVGYFLIWTT